MATVVFGDFEWSSEKAADNLEKHAVSFEEAATVFADLNYLLIADHAREGRLLALGFSGLARILVVVHIESGERIRIISARKATPRERLTYERRSEPE